MSHAVVSFWTSNTLRLHVCICLCHKFKAEHSWYCCAALYYGTCLWVFQRKLQNQERVKKHKCIKKSTILPKEGCSKRFMIQDLLALHIECWQSFLWPKYFWSQMNHLLERWVSFWDPNVKLFLSFCQSIAFTCKFFVSKLALSVSKPVVRMIIWRVSSLVCIFCDLWISQSSSTLREAPVCSSCQHRCYASRD